MRHRAVCPGEFRAYLHTVRAKLRRYAYGTYDAATEISREIYFNTGLYHVHDTAISVAHLSVGCASKQIVNL